MCVCEKILIDTFMHGDCRAVGMEKFRAFHFCICKELSCTAKIGIHFQIVFSLKYDKLGLTQPSSVNAG